MSWQHFTDFLGPGENITREQFAELVAAYEERLLATLGLQLDSQIAAEVLASDLCTDWIGLPAVVDPDIQPVDSGWSNAPGDVRLERCLQNLAYHAGFLRDPTGAIFDVIGNSSLLGLAANDLGYDYADIFPPSINNRSPLNLRARWNIMRRAIERMEWIAAPYYPDEIASWRKQGTGSTLDGAKTAFLSAQETVLGFPWRTLVRISGISGRQVEGFRSAGDLQIPSTPIFSAYDLRLIVRHHNNIETDLELTVDARTDTISLPLATSVRGARKTHTMTGLTTTGSVYAELCLTAYRDSSALAEFADNPFSTVEVFVDTPSLCFLRPAWEYT